MTFGERLTDLRISAGYAKRNEFADKLGIPSTTLRNYETDVREPGHTFLKQVSEFFNVSVDYLLGLTGDKEVLSSFRLKSSEYAHIEKYRSLDPHGQDMVDTILIKEYERVSKYGKLTAPSTIIEFHPKQDNNLLVFPYFRAGVSAGLGIFILGNEAEDEIELPALPEYEAADFAIDVNGDSMKPDFSHEDIALVQRDAEIHIGDVGVFIVNGDAFIKELGEKELISRNKKYKNIPIQEGDNVACMGKVIGKVMY